MNGRPRSTKTPAKVMRRKLAQSKAATESDETEVAAAERKLAEGRSQGKTVESHPLFFEIYEMSKFHFAPETILAVLRQRYGDKYVLPHIQTLYAWRSNFMPLTALVPRRLVFDKLNGLPLQIDVHQRLAQLFEKSEERLKRIFDFEEQLNGVPVAGLDRAIEVHLRVGEQLWSVAQDLGLAPSSAKPVQVGVFQFGAGSGVPDVRGQNVVALTKDDVIAAADALYQAREKKAPPPTGEARLKRPDEVVNP